MYSIWCTLHRLRYAGWMDVACLVNWFYNVLQTDFMWSTLSQLSQIPAPILRRVAPSSEPQMWSRPGCMRSTPLGGHWNSWEETDACFESTVYTQSWNIKQTPLEAHALFNENMSMLPPNLLLIDFQDLCGSFCQSLKAQPAQLA